MKRFIPFLISLITLTSCTGMLDDMQSQIDDLDSRVTALEKDSKLISENLSTVKKDLEAGLAVISALRKASDEIVDTLGACKFRMQNDLDASYEIVNEAFEKIENVDISNNLNSESSTLAQSIVNAYAAINVALTLSVDSFYNIEYLVDNVIGYQFSQVYNKLSSLESAVSDICSDCVFKRLVSYKGDVKTHTEVNKYNIILYREEFIVNPTDAYVNKYYYVPGQRGYTCSQEMSSGYRIYKYFPSEFVMTLQEGFETLSEPQTISHVYYPSLYQKQNVLRMSSNMIINQCHYMISSNEDYPIYHLFNAYQGIYPRRSVFLFSVSSGDSSGSGFQVWMNSEDEFELRLMKNNSIIKIKCVESQFLQMKEFITNVYDSKKLGDMYYNWTGFVKDWNSFIDSSDNFDNSFKL